MNPPWQRARAHTHKKGKKKQKVKTGSAVVDERAGGKKTVVKRGEELEKGVWGGWQSKEFELVAEPTRRETLAAASATPALIILALVCLTSPLSSCRCKLFRRIR